MLKLWLNFNISPIELTSLTLLICLFSGCSGISEITAFDNHDPDRPVAILSSVPLPQWDTPQPGECGCRAGERPNHNNPIIRNQDGTIPCDHFRPIESRRVSQISFADLKLNISDKEGVGCVQLVLSEGQIENTNSGDTGAADPAEFVQGECERHTHSADEPENAIHYKIEYDGTRRGQNPVFSYQRRELGPAWGSVIGGKLFMEYWDGDGERNRGTKWVYFYGPRESACER